MLRVSGRNRVVRIGVRRLPVVHFLAADFTWRRAWLRRLDGGGRRRGGRVFLIGHLVHRIVLLLTSSGLLFAAFGKPRPAAAVAKDVAQSDNADVGQLMHADQY